MNEQYLQEIIEYIKEKKPSKEKLSVMKNKLAKKYKLSKPATDIEIFLNAPEEDISEIKKYLLTKPVRTLSGIAVAAMMAKPVKCRHGTCIFCPGGPGSPFGNVPQSYTGKEPSTRRSIRNLYDPYLIMMNRIEQYIVTGHVPDKMEVIIQGGTFPNYPKKYQEDFVMYGFKAMNDFSDLFFNNGRFDFLKFKEFFELPADINDPLRLKRLHEKLLEMKNNEKTTLTTLEKEQLRNEHAKIRNVGLTIETKPDWGKLKHGNEMLKLGCTRIELGIQTIYDEVLRFTNRGHTLQDSIESIQILKDLGFKLNFHMMPGLPGVTKEMDLLSLRTLFTHQEFQPDMLKIYPCMVLQGTALYNLWKRGRFTPLSTKKAAEIIAEFKRYVPPFVRIVRVQRDIPSNVTEAGVDRTNLRQYVEEICRKRKIRCRCIRCREVGIALQKSKKKIRLKKPKVNVLHYPASNGNEFFISADDMKNDLLYGYCRLRFPYQFLREEITEDSALIRELHVVGQATALGEVGEFQHKGLGKALMLKAEEIAKTYYKNKIVVISAVGAREYFFKLGYKKDGPYMSKVI